MEKKLKEEAVQAGVTEATNKVNNAITEIKVVILLCETDPGDERYDNLHAIKNRLVTARKKLKQINLLNKEQ